MGVDHLRWSLFPYYNGWSRQKLGDFGLARACLQGRRVPSHQIATRWYRSPESLYGSRADSGGMDLWACGCILAELLNHSPLFAGENDIDQLYRIFRLRGTPDAHCEPWPEAETLPDFHKIRYRHWFGQCDIIQLLLFYWFVLVGRSSFPRMEAIPLQHILPDASPQALSLIHKLLIYPTAKRLPAAEVIVSFFSVPLAFSLFITVILTPHPPSFVFNSPRHY